MRYQVSINMHQGSSITLRWVWMYIPFLRFACQVCIRFSESKKKIESKKGAVERHIFTRSRHHHHKMLKRNAWIVCDNEYTRCYTFDIQLSSNSEWKSAAAHFKCMIFSAAMLCPYTYIRIYIYNNLPIEQRPHTHIMHQSIVGNATFYRINIGHNDSIAPKYDEFVLLFEIR